MAVQQQQINPLGWPILLQPAACTSLAFVGQGRADVQPLQVTAGGPFSALLETQDALGQRISQACCSQYLCVYVHVRMHARNQATIHLSAGCKSELNVASAFVSAAGRKLSMLNGRARTGCSYCCQSYLH